MIDRDIDLSVRIGGVSLRNPIILSPGPFGRTPLSLKHLSEAGCGAVCSKTLSSEPWKGNPNPKKMNLSCGWMLNSEGGPNIGIDAFAETMMEMKDRIKDSRVIISVVGKTPEEFVSLAGKAVRMGADILDLDITCPNVSEKGIIDSWQKDLDLLYDLIRAVKKAVSVPLWIKFISAYGTLLEIAKTLERAGADAVVPLVSVAGMAIDFETGKPSLGFKHGVGILTGPPLKYAELKAVADVRRIVKIPVIATGGCSSGQDILEYIMAGAKAVEMHTVFLQKGIGHAGEMISEVSGLMRKRGWTRLEDLVGLSLKYLPEKPFSIWYR
jgi:dihydroorotate dehydrogenase (NAD+) catalytic subunit